MDYRTIIVLPSRLVGGENGLEEYVNIGVLGSGVVGRTIGSALVARGETVSMGTRQPSDESGRARRWAAELGSSAQALGFGEAARRSELLFNCLPGVVCVDAIGAISPRDLDGKILIDVSNALDFTGPIPVVAAPEGGSVGERIQERCPTLRVVKALSTVTARLMVEPRLMQGTHDLLICGDDGLAKTEAASRLAEWFGWSSVVDLGTIKCAGAVESYLGLWIALRLNFGTSLFNIHIVRSTKI